MRIRTSFFALALLGCSSGESNAPGIQTRLPVTIQVSFKLSSGGSISATMDGKTYTQSPQFVAVPSGAVEINGTFSGTSLEISLGGLDDLVGVEAGSLQNILGPSAVPGDCGVSYTRSGTGSSSFRVTFTVSTRPGGHC